MKVLIAGNSQAACLRIAYGERIRAGKKTVDEWSFYVTPGGAGPYFDIESGLLKVTAINAQFPPFWYPEGTPTNSLDSYDLIVISALGYIDSGPEYVSSIMRQGLLHRFEPLSNSLVDRPLSEACFIALIANSLNSYQGSVFARKLRASYGGRIAIQPFPMLSSRIVDDSQWLPRLLYEDFMGAHRFFSLQRWSYLQTLADDIDATLLTYPVQDQIEDFLTPTEYMRQSDYLHASPRYGELVLEQIERLL